MLAVGGKYDADLRTCARGRSARVSGRHKFERAAVFAFDFSAKTELIKPLVNGLTRGIASVFYGDVGALSVAEKVFSRIYAPVKMIHIAALNGVIRVFAAAPVDEKRVKPFGYLNKIVSRASQ